MVSTLSIIFMFIAMVISVAMPIGIIIYFRRRYKISVKAVLVGVLVFILFSQVLEQLLHWYVFMNNSTTSSLLKNPWLYMIYGGLAAGIFEEVGRFIGFKYLLKGKTEWKDGIALGIGHGGIEAILIGGLTSIQYLIYSNLINSEIFDKTLGGKVPADILISIKDTLVNSPPYVFGLGGLERVFAVTFHIALSVLVLYSVKKRKNIYLFSAIIIHAVVDFLPALYQAEVLKNIFVIEVMVFIVAVLSGIFIIKSKKIFTE